MILIGGFTSVGYQIVHEEPELKLVFNIFLLVSQDDGDSEEVRPQQNKRSNWVHHRKRVSKTVS